MGTHEKLHLANNLDALDLLAKKDCDVKKLKFQLICNALSKLYKASQSNVLDQEMTYILLARYINLYNHLKNSQPDKKFVEIRFGSEYEKVLMQHEEIKRSLQERYAAKQTEVAPVKHVIEDVGKEIDVKPQRVFSDEFITCEQLFSALQKRYKLLLVDARPDSDFAESRIDDPNCVNVPDHCITPGLSANALGKKLPTVTQNAWELRETFDVIVLFDWNTSSDNFALTKLNKLRSAIVDWDFNRNYNEPPVILNGGYLELLQMYPTICTNPQVYLFQKNNELDELLELDHITYPTETNNKTLVMGVPEETTPNTENENVTKESLVEENKALTFIRHNVVAQLEEEEQEKKRINEQCNVENNINNIANMKKQVSEIDVEITRLKDVLEDVDKQRDDVKEKFKNSFQDELEDEPLSEDVKEPDKIDVDDSEKLKDIIDEERNRELSRARALKPKKPIISSNNNQIAEPHTPVINRATKPNLNSYILRHRVKPLETVTCGLVGLRNIRNTCYMSTVVQCLRNIPAIADLFCSGIYAKANIRNPAAIIHETASLVRQLWSKPVKSLDPNEFYNKVCQLKTSYKLGNHEDCMEFFLFLLNNLCEDCCYDVNLPTVMTPKQRAWYNQFEGKNSVFIDLFYHQIRIKQNCNHCDQKTTYKFEIESTFMLSVPEHDFSLEDLMDDYMDDYIIPEYCCAKCKQPVNNQKEICYGPKIVVIVLKRYRQVAVQGSVTLRKVESRAHFQKKNFRLGNCFYQLNAIAMHSGDMNYGHYTAAALTPKGWYEFNDEMVRPININDESLKVKACAFFYSMCDD